VTKEEQHAERLREERARAMMQFMADKFDLPASAVSAYMVVTFDDGDQMIVDIRRKD
jgi:hypothetical protein